MDLHATRLRRVLLRLIADARLDLSPGVLDPLLRAGRLREIEAALDRVGSRFAEEVLALYLLAAATVGRDFAGFDVTGPRVVQTLAARRQAVVASFGTEQRGMLREVLTSSVVRDESPRETALLVWMLLGFTQRQAREFLAYRANLLQQAAGAKTRFPTKAQLTSSAVQRRVAASDALSWAEASRSVRSGEIEAYAQAVDAGLLVPEDIVQVWRTRRDLRVRDTHRPMHGQERLFGVPFTSGGGASLRYPHDPLAPFSETVSCRCTVATRVSRR